MLVCFNLNCNKCFNRGADKSRRVGSVPKGGGRYRFKISGRGEPNKKKKARRRKFFWPKFSKSQKNIRHLHTPEIDFRVYVLYISNWHASENQEIQLFRHMKSIFRCISFTFLIDIRLKIKKFNFSGTWNRFSGVYALDF